MRQLARRLVLGTLLVLAGSASTAVALPRPLESLKTLPGRTLDRLVARSFDRIVPATAHLGTMVWVDAPTSGSTARVRRLVKSGVQITTSVQTNALGQRAELIEDHLNRTAQFVFVDKGVLQADLAFSRPWYTPLGRGMAMRGKLRNDDGSYSLVSQHSFAGWHWWTHQAPGKPVQRGLRAYAPLHLSTSSGTVYVF